MSEVVHSFELVLRRILNALPGYAYQIADEKRVQQGIAEVLAAAGVPFVREHTDGDDRFDFLCGGSIVIEVKIEGSMSEALRQVARYSRHDYVEAVVIASSRHWGAARDGYNPQGYVRVNGKPVHVVKLRGRAF